MITSGPGGTLWFLETAANNLAEFDPTTHTFATFTIPTARSGATFLTAGADGSLYFTAPNANQLVRFDPATQTFLAFPIPMANSGASFITLGLDGMLYFTETTANRIGQFNPVVPSFASYPIPTASSGAEHITTGPDGNLYFTESTANRIGVAQPSPRFATTTRLTATPNPALVGQAVTLTATVNTVFPGTSTGTVAFSIDGNLRASVRVTLLDGQGQATFQVAHLAPGSHALVATFTGNSTLGASLSVPVSLIVNPAPDDGPVVLAVRRFGFHAQRTVVVLKFDQLLNPTTAEDAANYQIFGRKGKSILVASASYNLVAGTVTLFPVQRLSIRRSYVLTVIGTGPAGVTGANGKLLDGAYTGQPGNNFVTTLNAASLARLM
jgi:hypothetical protein